MSDQYYVQFIDMHRDIPDTVVVVSAELFAKLLPFADDLDNGTWDTAEPWVSEAFALPDADLRPSEIEAIPDDHFLTALIV